MGIILAQTFVMKYFFSLLFIVVIIGITIGQTVIILDTPGSGTWPVPPGVSAITVELWGAGGGGAQNQGGGGGGYSKEENFPVTCGTDLYYYIGTGGQGGGGFVSSTSTGGVTATSGEFTNIPGLIAYGGAAGDLAGGGGGGSSSSSGGSGYPYSQGATENGEEGIYFVDGGQGGKAGGIEGGLGGDPNGVIDGAAPGGGGSMAPPSGIGGNGGNGRIKITILGTSNQSVSYQTVEDGDFFDPAVWGGCVPPNPIPANVTLSISHALSNMGTLINHGTILYTNVVPFLNSGSYQGSGIFQGSFQNMGTVSPSSN